MTLSVSVAAEDVITVSAAAENTDPIPSLKYVDETKTSSKDKAENILLQQFKQIQQLKSKVNRKRRHSTAEDVSNSSNKGPTAKHRRQNSGHNRNKYAGDIILPTKFLLGGNISDPLNLNSMLDEKINRAANAVTPSSSPLPPRSSKISIVIPSDMTDPLGLNLSEGAEENGCEVNDNLPKAADQVPEESVKTSHKRKKRRRKSQHEKAWLESKKECEGETTPDMPNLQDAPSKKENSKGGKTTKNKKGNGSLLDIEQDEKVTSEKVPVNLSIAISQISGHVVDPIVSPVIPQDTRRKSIVSPKSKKRKSLSQGPGKHLQFQSSEDVSNQSIGDKVDNICPSKKNHNQDTLSEELMCRIKAAREQSDVVKGNNIDTSDSHPRSKDPPTQIANVKFKVSNARFQFGNYTKYYGYRNPLKFQDIRLGCFKKEWFKDKDVLDVGCNSGHFTLLIARDFSPRKVVGIDIDGDLINIARKNVRHYSTAATKPLSTKISKYPDSLAVLYGPIGGPPLETGKDDLAKFPNNVVFLQGNYVPEKDEVLHCQEPEYDVIMCMSVSKWIHLNWGDEGIKKTFCRFYKQLRPGGKLILEPQEWKSYGKKKKLTEKIYNTYNSIKLKPDLFPRYLTGEIGFEKVEYLKIPENNPAKGFQRPIQLYYKPQ